MLVPVSQQCNEQPNSTSPLPPQMVAAGAAANAALQTAVQNANQNSTAAWVRSPWDFRRFGLNLMSDVYKSNANNPGSQAIISALVRSGLMPSSLAGTAAAPNGATVAGGGAVMPTSGSGPGGGPVAFGQGYGAPGNSTRGRYRRVVGDRAFAGGWGRRGAAGGGGANAGGPGSGGGYTYGPNGQFGPVGPGGGGGAWPTADGGAGTGGQGGGASSGAGTLPGGATGGYGGGGTGTGGGDPAFMGGWGSGTPGASSGGRGDRAFAGGGRGSVGDRAFAGGSPDRLFVAGRGGRRGGPGGFTGRGYAPGGGPVGDNGQGADGRVCLPQPPGVTTVPMNGPGPGFSTPAVSPNVPPPTIAPMPPQIVPPAPQTCSAQPSGNICMDLRNGIYQASQVPISVVLQCSQLGYVQDCPACGTQSNTPVSVDQAALNALSTINATSLGPCPGLSGLGDAYPVSCKPSSGNQSASAAAAASASAAVSAISPWWWVLLGAGVIFVMGSSDEKMPRTQRRRARARRAA